jgi:hypothetical protein
LAAGVFEGFGADLPTQNGNEAEAHFTPETDDGDSRAPREAIHVK